MIKRLLPLTAGAALVLAVAGCASLNPDHPAHDKQYVSVVNSLTWNNPMTGKRDGLRSSWPLATLKGQEEVFPLAQLRQCDSAGACAWGVMSARRNVGDFSYQAGGVKLDLALQVEVDRRQETRRPDFHAAMAIPANVSSLRSSQELRRTLTLEYGKVQGFDLDYGVRFEVCVLRYDAAGRALDVCAIPHL